MSLRSVVVNRPFAGGRHGVADGNGLFLDRDRQ
jgi:hypothetical protein